MIGVKVLQAGLVIKTTFYWTYFYLVIRTVEKSWKQSPVNCWNTNDEIFLSQNCIKVMSRHHVQVDRKPGKYKFYFDFTFVSF